MTSSAEPDLIAEALGRICPAGVLRNVPLATLSQWRIGGNADFIVRPSSIGEVARLRSWLHANSIPHIVIGSTSNLLFADEGLRVPCIQIGEYLSRVSIRGIQVEAEAGAWVPALARRIMLAGLSGAEHVCGIPGTLGGLICMNGGSQRKGIGSSIKEVQSIDQFGNLKRRTAEECHFSYRSSIFQKNAEIIVNCALHFPRAFNRSQVRREMIDILNQRRNKFPRKLPNCGSVFVSDPAMYSEYGTPGAVIERCGLKGASEGDALVSSQHANFIVNQGSAKARDVLSLIGKIKRVVYATVGHSMAVEVRYVTEDGLILPADKAFDNRRFGAIIA